jgi:hypothetical protein
MVDRADRWLLVPSCQEFSILKKYVHPDWHFSGVEEEPDDL